MTRRFARLVLTVLLALVIQGCVVTMTGEDELRSAWDEWDLTRPPTRTEIGIPDGKTTVIHQDSPTASET